MSRPLVRSRRRKQAALLPESLRRGLVKALRWAGGSVVIALALGIAAALFT